MIKGRDSNLKIHMFQPWLGKIFIQNRNEETGKYNNPDFV